MTGRFVGASASTMIYGGCTGGTGESESSIGYCSSICGERNEPNQCIGEGLKMHCAVEWAGLFAINRRLSEL